MFGTLSKARWVAVLLVLLLVLSIFAIGQNIKYGGTLKLVEPYGAW
jgi:ABC-type cobalt transport system substrate-binding protein